MPAGYHLCTFTVPEELRAAIRSHPREGLAILFAASSSALLDACANPKWFGARPGATGVLHTNTRALIYHPHVHYVVTGGGLASDGTWRKAGARFLVPVRVLSALFRARFRDALRQRLPEVFAALPPAVWRRDWVVHSKAVGDGKNVLRYLSRYLYRVALADSAILAHDAQTVAFRYRDSATHKTRKMVLPVVEFIRRFLQHVLPSGFVKVRHYGLHHPSRSSAAFSRPRNALPAPGHSRAGRPAASVPQAMPVPAVRRAHGPHRTHPAFPGGSGSRTTEHPMKPLCPHPARNRRNTRRGAELCPAAENRCSGRLARAMRTRPDTENRYRSAIAYRRLAID